MSKCGCFAPLKWHIGNQPCAQSVFTGNFFGTTTNIKYMSHTTICLSLISSLGPDNHYVQEKKLPFKTSATHERRQSGRRALRAVCVHFVTIDVAFEQLWPFRERHRKHSVWKAHWRQPVWCSVIKAALECVCPPPGWFCLWLFQRAHYGNRHYFHW